MDDEKQPMDDFDEEDFNYESEEETPVQNNIDEDLNYTGSESVGEKFSDKAILEMMIDTELLLKNLQRNMEGLEEINGTFVQVRLPIARDETIAFIINSLRSIINPSNSLSYMEADAAKVSTYEKILEFEYLTVEDVLIDAKDQETLINMCDHTLELFYGKVVEGHLTDAMKTFFVGQNIQQDKPKEQSFFSLERIMGKSNN